MRIPGIGTVNFAREKPPMDEQARATISGTLRSFMMGFVEYQDDLTGVKGYSTYAKMKADAKVQACLSQISAMILGKGWDVIPAEGDYVSESEATAQAEFVKHALDSSRGSFADVLLDVLDAIPMGWSIIEMLWRTEEQEPWKGYFTLAGLKSKDPQSFQMDCDEFGNIKSLRQPAIVESLEKPYPPEKFLLYTNRSPYGNPFGQSDLRAAYSPWFLKDTTRRLFGIYMVRLATPTPYGKYKMGTSKALQDEMLSILDKFQRETAMVIPETWTLDFLQVATGSHEAFLRCLDWCNSEIATAILSQTLTSGQGDGTGSYSLGKVHLDVLAAGLDIHRKRIEESFYDQVIRRLVDYNFDKRFYPRLKITRPERDEMKDWAAALFQANGLNVQIIGDDDVPQIRERLGLTAPAPEPLLPETPAGSPGKAEGDTEEESTTAFDARVRHGASEQPRDKRTAKIIDDFQEDLRQSAESLEERVFLVLGLNPNPVPAQFAAYKITDEQVAAIEEAFNNHFEEVAGMRRDLQGFVSPTTDMGIIQHYYLDGLSLGVLQARTATGGGPANVLLTRDAASVQRFLARGFERLSKGGQLRLEAVLPDVKRIIQSGMDLGQNPLEIARTLKKRFDNYKGWEFERLARTEVAFAQNAGYIAECEAGDVDTSRVDTSAIPAHPNCILEGTRVIAPDIVAGLRAFYDGEVLEITLADGRQLSVTPNHMLLTPLGFASAQLLCEGDNVLSYGLSERIIAGRPDDDNSPAAVEKIFEAMLEANKVGVLRIPPSGDDLHGDAVSVQGYIHVIGTNGLLNCDAEAEIAEHRGATPLGGANPCGAPFFGQSALASLFQTAVSPADRRMSGNRSPAPFFKRRGLLANYALAAVPNRNVPLMQPAVYDDARDSELPRQLLDRGSGLIAVQPIVSIRRFNFCGHVYDLQTNTSLYLADGIVSSNCLCTYSTREIDGRTTLVYEVAMNACEKCLAIAATNPV